MSTAIGAVFATDSSFIDDVSPTVLVVILSGVVGFVAGWAGRLIERRDKQAEWRRDQLLLASNDLVLVVIQGTEAVDRWTYHPDRRDRSALLDDKVRQTHKANAAKARLHLIDGPRGLSVEGGQLIERMMSLYDTAADGGDEPSIRGRRAQVSSAYDTFADKASIRFRQ